MKAFFAALQFLTLFPWPRRAARSADEIGAGALFFPLVGLVLGAVLVLADYLLRPYFPPALLAVALVALLALLSRAFHLDGLADTFDGLGAGGARERMLKIMDDPHIGVFGVAAVVLVLLFKIEAIEPMIAGTADCWRALLIAPMLGRWAMVLAAYRSAAAKEGLGSSLIGRMSGAQLFFATVITFVLAAGFARGTGLWVMAWVALFTLACKSYFHRRLGGLTGDAFGAVEELSESSALILFALAQR
ncbi:MAG TPA: adenosylcobinamide-GDP ribazoletransferase [Candidatus Binatia bacterium]